MALQHLAGLSFPQPVDVDRPGPDSPSQFGDQTNTRSTRPRQKQSGVQGPVTTNGIWVRDEDDSIDVQMWHTTRRSCHRAPPEPNWAVLNLWRIIQRDSTHDKGHALRPHSATGCLHIDHWLKIRSTDCRHFFQVQELRGKDPTKDKTADKGTTKRPGRSGAFKWFVTVAITILMPLPPPILTLDDDTKSVET